MRRAPALVAAALLALALGAPGCKPSSLTPFTDWRGTDTGDTNVNGSWEGTNSTGLLVSFQVGSDTVTNLLLRHAGESCTIRFESSDAEAPVSEDGAFDFELFPDQGRFVLEGRFTSGTACSGTYSFEALAAAGSCPTSGSGTFTASKIE